MVTISVIPGAGGAESGAWAQMLLGMYMNWAFEAFLVKDVRVRLDDAKIELRGEGVYDHLKSEIGVHRLVRLSPFDPAHRRHTSFATVIVSSDQEPNPGLDKMQPPIRSYVFHPYKMVKDHRTDVETEGVEHVLCGHPHIFLNSPSLSKGAL